MRKRERENPCGVCGHYHKYEEGEVCGICGHRLAVSSSSDAALHAGAFPTEILPDFLFLGSYDNASRSELLKTQGISRILNTVPACQTLYKNSFTYYSLQEGATLQFDDAINFLEQCFKDKARVLVHCMSGKNRSPAIVIAYLMKCKGWKLAQSFQWVKERRPIIELSPAIYQQLVDYEKQLVGSNPAPSFPTSDAAPPFAFGISQPSMQQPVNNIPPIFNQPASSSLFGQLTNMSSNGFVFGATRNSEQPSIAEGSTFGITPSAGTETPMDGF